MSTEILLDRRNVDIFHKIITFKPLILKTKQNKTKLGAIFLTGIFHKTHKTIKKSIVNNFIYDSIYQHK